jgi:acyl-CoA synthetase (NDP forming)
MADLSRLLRPATIAVIGGKPAAEVVRQNRRMGYRGTIWPVHLKAQSVEGLPAFRALSDLPGVPDAVFLAVNRHATIDYVRELAAMGAGGVVSYAAGFAETGAAGEALQAALRSAAGAMPVLGPNCYGLINYLDGALLWPDQHGGGRVAKGVAIVTQSGNIGCNITMQRRALPIAYLVTMGNQALVGLSAAIETLARDARVTAIGLHIEGIDDPAAFARAVAVARARGKPVVALKTGGSAAGARLTVSHTASLAGADGVVTAFLKRLGVARVGSIPVLLETLKLLHAYGPLPGGDIASMSCSGGEAALIADRSEARRIRLRPLDAAQTRSVAATLGELVTVSNPLDYHTFSWADGPALTATFTAMLNCNFDLAALILDYPRDDKCDDSDWVIAADALIAAHRATGRPAAIIATLPECLPEDRSAALLAAGVVPLHGMDEALAAIEAALRIEAGELPITGGAPVGEPMLLDEVRSKGALNLSGVLVPAGLRARTPEEAVAAARRIQFPVVLKVVSDRIAHKSEHQAVRLNLGDERAVRTAAVELFAIGETLLVEAMVLGAVAELIVGVNRDPAIGPYMVIGSGGVLVELVGDTAILMMPTTDSEIRAAIATLKVARLLAGWRGRPAGDMQAVVQTVLAIQDFALRNLDRLLEIDVNPLVVLPECAVAVDALIRVVKEADHD